MDLPELEDFLDQILRGIQEILQSGEILTDEFQGLIAQELTYLTTEIDRLRAQTQVSTTVPTEPTPTTPETQPTTPTSGTGQGVPPTGGQVPPLEQAPFESSNISGFRYEPQDKSLYIQFLGKHPNRNGSVYRYSGVPVNLFNLLRRGAVAPRTSGRNAWHRWQEGKTPSHGAAAYALIREGNYPYTRIS